MSKGPRFCGKTYSHKRTAIGVGLLGKRLKTERMRRGWTVLNFSVACDIHPCTLTGYENRGVYPTLRNAITIATVLECSIDWLVGLED
jgi:transcriptional regulator with XRE-family HTH domain